MFGQPYKRRRRRFRRAAMSSHCRGFTLIEMVVVTAIISLMAALFMPNLVAFKRGRDQRDLAAAVLRLPTEARNQSLKSKDTVSLRVDGTDLVMEDIAADTGEANEIKRVPFGGQFQVTGAQQGSESTDPGAWKWQAYPDGTSDAGGLTFQVGQSSVSMWIPADAPAKWITGQMPSPKDDSWTAGNLLLRTGSAAAGGT